MRVVVTADLHGVLPEIEECDILILGGDICPDHPIGKAERYALPDNGSDYQLDWLDRSFRKWLLEVPATHIVGTSGNHDFVFERMRQAVADLYLPWIYLEDQEVEINGLRIYGTPWVPGLPRWAFSPRMDVLRERTKQIPEGLDILITHGPPLGTADTVGPRFGGPRDVGNPYLPLVLDKARPKVVVTGHIHEAYGKYPLEYGGTLYSVSLNDDTYDPINPPILLKEFLD